MLLRGGIGMTLSLVVRFILGEGLVGVLVGKGRPIAVVAA